MKKRFIEFLKKNEAYDKFVRNAQADHGATLDGIISRWTDSTRWIGAAFNWDTTPEGREYWRNLDAAWKKVLFFSQNY